MENSEIGKTGDGFINRSKVRILLCDNDEKSAGIVRALLCNCSYQVTSVISPRQLGLAEKNILNYDPDLFASDPSDGNTNSTTLFSDDTDDKARTSTNPETCASIHQEGKTNINNAIAPMETVTRAPVECQPDVPGISEGQVVLFPKKNELKIGGSSAFFTYVKSSTPNSNTQVSSSANEISSENLKIVEKLTILGDEVCSDIKRHDDRNPLEKCSRGDGDPVMSVDASQPNSQEEFTEANIHLENDNSNDVVPDSQEHTAAFPFYISGVMNQATMPPASTYHKNLADVHSHANSTILSHYNHNPQFTPHIPGMPSYPYYPFMYLQTVQTPTPRCPAHENNASHEGKLHKVDRRQAALLKFRQKRMERCFDKKIRYVNRKTLAERRPRVRGQFVRKVNGVNVDLNGQPPSAKDDQEEKE